MENINDEKLARMANEVHEINRTGVKDSNFIKVGLAVTGTLLAAGILSLFTLNNNVVILLERDGFKQQQLDKLKDEIQEVKAEVKQIKNYQKGPE